MFYLKAIFFYLIPLQAGQNFKKASFDISPFHFNLKKVELNFKKSSCILYDLV